MKKPVSALSAMLFVIPLGILAGCENNPSATQPHAVESSKTRSTRDLSRASSTSASTNQPTTRRSSVLLTSEDEAHLSEPVPTAPPLLAVEPAETDRRQVYRPDDVVRQHDDAALAELGIRRYESRRLRLYTDIEPDKAARLPPQVDQLYDALTDYFGPLPPERSGREYRMTGYLIRDLALFRETGLVPDDLPTFEHGRHRANEFWLRDQEFDYYRAHLLFHEATHSFMTCLPRSEVSVWYMEGMAEVFGTHRMDRDGKLDFGIMPTSPEEVAGWGRISLIRQAFARNEMRMIPEMFDYIPAHFFEPVPYAWSWGLCMFLKQHPRYADRFRQLAREGRNPEFPRMFQQLYERDANDLAAEWLLFIVNLQYGYDVRRAAIEFTPGTPLVDSSRNVGIVAHRGWQSSGIELQQGQTYAVTSTGRVTLAENPKPWISEPDGISIDYVDGQPIGKVLACMRMADGTQPETLLRVLPVGSSRTFEAPLTGTLYLRVNDGWDRLADNTGEYVVTIRRMP